MIIRKAQSERRQPRGKEKKRVTVRAIYKAIKNYPNSSGASVRDICRIISKQEPDGRSRRSVSSVKMAIARAVRSGSIRAPKGWQGFRGIDTARSTPGRRPSGGKPGRPAGRRKSAAKSVSRRKSGVRRKSGPRRGGRGRMPSKGPGRRGRSAVRRGRPPGRGGNTNSSHANRSDNYNTNENDGDTTSMWRAYTCVIS